MRLTPSRSPKALRQNGRYGTVAALAALCAAAGPLRAQESCRGLERAARGMALDYSESMQSSISCGTDGEYRASEYALPTLADAPMEMHVIGVHRGSFLPGEEHTRQTPGMMGVRVVVYKTRLPALLVFTAHDDTLWDVTLTQEARVDRVVLQGRGEQRIKGIPDSIPVIHRRYEDSCGYAYGWEKTHNRFGENYRLMIQSLRCATGLRETSFQGCYSGAIFEIPHRKTETIREPWSPPCPLPGEPELVGPPKGATPAKAGGSRQERPFAGGSVFAPHEPPGMGPPSSEVASRPEPENGILQPYGQERLPGPVSPSSRAEEAKGAKADVPASRREAPSEGLATSKTPAGQRTLPRPEGVPPRKEEPVKAEPEQGAFPGREAASGGLKPHKGHPKEDLSRPSAVPGRGDIPVRALAILLEGRHELATHDAIPDLIEAMEKGDTLLRWRAADELGKMGPAAERAIEPLSRALQDPEADVRSSAALALGNIGPKSESAVRRLKKLLKDRSADVRYSAQTALKRIGTPKALKALGK